MLEAGRDENNTELKQEKVLGWASLTGFKLCSGTEGKFLNPCETIIFVSLKSIYRKHALKASIYRHNEKS